VAAVSMPWLVSIARSLSPRIGVAAAPLLVWVLCVGIFGLSGPGGDQVLVPDWRALLLIVGGALPAALMVGGPRR
jgi:hypothetical protein